VLSVTTGCGVFDIKMGKKTSRAIVVQPKGPS